MQPKAAPHGPRLRVLFIATEYILVAFCRFKPESFSVLCPLLSPQQASWLPQVSHSWLRVCLRSLRGSRILSVSDDKSDQKRRLTSCKKDLLWLELFWQPCTYTPLPIFYIMNLIDAFCLTSLYGVTCLQVYKSRFLTLGALQTNLPLEDILLRSLLSPGSIQNQGVGQRP